MKCWAESGGLTRSSPTPSRPGSTRLQPRTLSYVLNPAAWSYKVCGMRRIRYHLTMRFILYQLYFLCSALPPLLFVVNRDDFLRATACSASRVSAIVQASVCPSVCPSVTLCDCIKTAQALWAAPRTLVFWWRNGAPRWGGFFRTRASKRGTP